MAEYPINKGIGRPVEFKGLKAQYLFIFCGGLLALFVLFVILYICLLYTSLVNTIDKTQIMKYPALAKLGKEANDETFTEQELLNKLSKKNIFIKTALLDQEIICGLGNIYVDEVCFMSKLNPFTLTKEITIKDAESILESSRIVIAKAIQAGGCLLYTSRCV